MSIYVLQEELQLSGDQFHVLLEDGDTLDQSQVESVTLPEGTKARVAYDENTSTETESYYRLTVKQPKVLKHDQEYVDAKEIYFGATEKALEANWDLVK